MTISNRFKESNFDSKRHQYKTEIQILKHQTFFAFIVFRFQNNNSPGLPTPLILDNQIIT